MASDRISGLGSAKQMTLAEARQKATVLRKAVKVEKRDVLAEKKDEAAAKVTFRAAATQYHSENEAGWKSTVYAASGSPVSKTTPSRSWVTCRRAASAAADIISVLTPIWQEIPDTARQVRNRICAVLDYSHAKGWRSREAPSGNSSLKAGRGLPRQVKVREIAKPCPMSRFPDSSQPYGVNHPSGGLRWSCSS
jgi:hypothetical protein